MVTTEKLETLFAKVRALPKARQELAVEALSEIADEESYTLSDDERALLESALDVPSAVNLHPITMSTRC
jgi:hypothetical protein